MSKNAVTQINIDVGWNESRSDRIGGRQAPGGLCDQIDGGGKGDYGGETVRTSLDVFVEEETGFGEKEEAWEDDDVAEKQYVK